MPNHSSGNVLLLAQIARLWTELHHFKQGTPRYEALIEQIRRDADRFRAAAELQPSSVRAAS
jgi:hypothetical protein